MIGVTSSAFPMNRSPPGNASTREQVAASTLCALSVGDWTTDLHWLPMDHKQRVREVMGAMSQGRVAPLFEAMAEDVTWRWMGVNQWSRTFGCKQIVVDTLFGGATEAIGPFLGVFRRCMNYMGRHATFVVAGFASESAHWGEKVGVTVEVPDG